MLQICKHAGCELFHASAANHGTSNGLQMNKLVDNKAKVPSVFGGQRMCKTMHVLLHDKIPYDIMVYSSQNVRTKVVGSRGNPSLYHWCAGAKLK